MGLQSEIGRAVNWDAPSVDENETLREVIRKLLQNQVSALVVKSEGKVMGIVTDLDIMASVDRGSDLDLTKALNFMTPCELISGKAVKSPCTQLDPGQSVANALGVMNIASTHHLLVSENHGKVGMVSLADLLSLVVE